MQVLPEYVATEDSVIVHFQLRDDHWGTEEDDDFIIELDLELAASIDAAGVGWYDYHETGEGWARLFAYGRDADSLAFVIRRALADRDLPSGAYLLKEFIGPGGRADGSDEPVTSPISAWRSYLEGVRKHQSSVLRRSGPENTELAKCNQRQSEAQ